MTTNAERLKTVARIWNDATASGLPRVATVQESFPDVTPRTIQRWIGEARQAGLLPAARPGNWGTNEQKLRATAGALGVSYEALVIALREQIGNSSLKISASEERAVRAALAGGEHG